MYIIKRSLNVIFTAAMLILLCACDTDVKEYSESFSEPVVSESVSLPDTSYGEESEDEYDAVEQGFALEKDADGYILTGYSGGKGEVTIPKYYKGEPIHTIASEAFYGKAVYELTIPETVKTIDEFAFCNSGQLETINFSEGLETIGDYAFHTCYELNNLKLPASVEHIGEAVFAYCRSLTELSVDSANEKYRSESGCIIELESKTLVAGCKSAVIPADGSVESIAAKAFYNIYVESMYIPETVRSIGDNAFANSRLGSVFIPASVESIGTGAFSNHYLSAIRVDEANPVYHSKDGCLIETASKTLIAGCKYSGIPQDGSVTEIGDYAFLNIPITAVTIPEGTVRIGANAFSGTYISSIVVPESVKAVDYGAFASDSFKTVCLEAEFPKNYIEGSRDATPDGWDENWYVGCDAEFIWSYGE